MDMRKIRKIRKIKKIKDKRRKNVKTQEKVGKPRISFRDPRFPSRDFDVFRAVRWV